MYLGEFFVAEVALMRLAALVQFDVVVEVAGLCELLMTNRTLEGLLAVVEAHMIDEVA